MGEIIFFENVVLPVLGMGMGAFALFGIYRTINRHLDRRHEKEMAGGTGFAAGQLDELRARVEDLEEGAIRMQELEERLDFAERMIAQQDRRQIDGSKTGD